MLLVESAQSAIPSFAKSISIAATMGDVTSFPRGKQVASYLGLIPREHSSLQAESGIGISACLVTEPDYRNIPFRIGP